MPGDSYILSYPALLGYFDHKPTISSADLVIAAHMVYGWMPRILRLHPKTSNLILEERARLLTRARTGEILTDDEICSIASLINNSLVGTSKLLHFMSPSRYAIWDSKVYTFVHGKKPHGRMREVKLYREYLKILDELQRDPRFPNFHKSVQQKIGYDVTAYRALEIVMFERAPNFAG